MDLSVRSLVNIFNFFANPIHTRFAEKSFETVLKRSLTALQSDILNETQNFVRQNQTNTGGFADRAGTPDPYYSLFGFFLSKTLSLTESFTGLKKYVLTEVDRNDLGVIDFFSITILYSQLFPKDGRTRILRRKIKTQLKHTQINNDQPSDVFHKEYIVYLGVLALYYTGDYYYLWKFLNRADVLPEFASDKIQPAPTIAAAIVVLHLTKMDTSDAVSRLQSFYDSQGGFRATQGAPVSDLLTTAVSLYALDFAGIDLSPYKADCFQFVERHYEDGGFLGTVLDQKPDIEYTFYGLLTLGLLNT